MASDNKLSPRKQSPAPVAPRSAPARVFFPPVDSDKETNEQESTSQTPPPAAVPAPAAEQKVVGKIKEPKPLMVPRAIRISPENLDKLANMLDTAPRHVTKQVLMDFILTDFFKRSPELPEQLRRKGQ
jgi:hypothetical protein